MHYTHWRKLHAPCPVPPPPLQWIEEQNSTASSRLYGQADVGRLATAGHSRGGKLASLAFTGAWLLRVTACCFHQACACCHWPCNKLSKQPKVISLTPFPFSPHAEYPDLVRAAYLVDPVDVTQYSPESKDYPSGEAVPLASFLT